MSNPQDSLLLDIATGPPSAPPVPPAPWLDAGATFGGPADCYRYRLWRVWDAELPRMAWVMLNPSTADATKEDPTIRRCIGFARRAGFGSIEIVNLFALRATDPAELRRVADPVGPENDAAIASAYMGANRTILAWGNHGSLRDRARGMLARIHDLLVWHYGTLTNQGHPRHPLYLPGELQPTCVRADAIRSGIAPPR